MGRVGRHLGIDFVISVGDNFYQEGLKGPKDPKFRNSFSKVYTAQSLQTQWFAGEDVVLTTQFLFSVLPFGRLVWVIEVGCVSVACFHSFVGGFYVQFMFVLSRFKCHGEQFSISR